MINITRDKLKKITIIILSIIVLLLIYFLYKETVVQTQMQKCVKKLNEEPQLIDGINRCFLRSPYLESQKKSKKVRINETCELINKSDENYPNYTPHDLNCLQNIFVI
jgi:hypothetical protein